MWITPLPPPLTALGEGSHGSILNGNYAPNRLSSAWKPTRKAMKVDWNQTIEARAMKLRDDVKATELRAEQIEVHMLDQFLNEFSLSGGGDTTRNLHEVAGLMLHGQGLSDALPDDAIFIIDSITGFPGLARQ